MELGDLAFSAGFAICRMANGRGNSLAHFGWMGHSDTMNKDISNIVLELCEAVEAYRPLSDTEGAWRMRALGQREGAWTAEDDKWLRQLVDRGMPRQKLAEAMSRTNMSVRKRIQSLRRSGFIEAVK